jgi:hypothetical protein
MEKEYSRFSDLNGSTKIRSKYLMSKVQPMELGMGLRALLLQCNRAKIIIQYHPMISKIGYSDSFLNHDANMQLQYNRTIP